jgi:rifampicin phosphotransferase
MEAIMIMPLISEPALDAGKTGRKAASLARAALAGIPVLPGFVILTTELDAHIANHVELRSLWEQITSTPEADLGLEMNLYELQKKIGEFSLSDNLRAELKNWLETIIGVDDIVLRSSSIMEDDVNSSGAGVYTSFLKISRNNLVEIEKAVLAIWASAFNLPILKIAQGVVSFDYKKLGMAVLIQPYMNTEVGGVLFTVHPAASQANHMLLEAVSGATSKLVSGSSPDMIAIAPRVIEEGSRGEILTGESLLSTDLVTELFDAGRYLENLYQDALDIEWGMVDQRVTIFQARPITCLATKMTQDWEPLEVIDVDDLARCAGKDLKEAKTLADRWMEKKYWIRTAAREISVAIYSGFYIGVNVDTLQDGRLDSKKEAILSSIRTPFVQVELGRLKKATLPRDELFSYLLEETEDDGMTHVYRVREYIPNEISGFAALTPDDSIYIEFAPGGLMGLMFGDVPVSTYVISSDRTIQENLVPVERCYLMNPQTSSFEITENPRPNCSLPAKHLEEIEKLTRHMQKRFGQPRLEWFIWDDQLYFSDLTIEQGELVLSNYGSVISAGVAHGRALVIDDDLMNALIQISREFNISVRPQEEDERAKETVPVKQLIDQISKTGEDVILVSSMPVNSLLLCIPFVRGMIFESGAMLCHLAISLREAKLPGLVVSNARTSVCTGDTITIYEDGKFHCSLVRPVS